MEKEEVKQNQKIKTHKLITIFEQQTSNKLHFNVNETIKSLYAHNNINTTLSWGIEYFTVINEKNYFKFLIPCFWVPQMEEEDIYQKGLVLKVSAYRHKGLILITLNKNDLYDIDLISTKKGVKKRFTNLYFDEIVATINKAIG